MKDNPDVVCRLMQGTKKILDVVVVRQCPGEPCKCAISLLCAGTKQVRGKGVLGSSSIRSRDHLNRVDARLKNYKEEKDNG